LSHDHVRPVYRATLRAEGQDRHVLATPLFRDEI
jgi:hypothetical protein